MGIPGIALVLISLRSFIDFHLAQAEKPMLWRRATSNYALEKNALIAKINKHILREIAYDLFQMATIAYAIENFKFDEEEFQLKKALDFCNIVTTVIDVFLLKGYAAF